MFSALLQLASAVFACVQCMSANMFDSSMLLCTGC